MRRGILDPGRVGVLVFGLALVVVASLLLAPAGDGDGLLVWFTTFDLLVLYLVAVLPVLFAGDLRRLTAAHLAAGGVLWRGIVAYAALTVVLLALAWGTDRPPLALLVLAQGVGLVVLFVYAALAGGVHDHIARVEARQRDGRSGVDDLRERSRRLAARVEGLAADDPGRARLAAAIRSIDEDLRYVSPAEGSEAAELEDRMAAGLAVLEDVVARDMDAGEVQEAVDVSGRVAADLALRRSLRTERAAGRSRAVEDEG